MARRKPVERPEEKPEEDEIDNARVQANAREAVMHLLEQKADPDGTLTLSNGIVLNIMCPPPALLRRASSKLEEPKPPVVLIEDKGVREENPSDPDYLRALAEYKIATYAAAADVALMTGTSCRSVPDGWYRPEDDGWLDYLTLLGIDEDISTPVRRYWAWIRYYALRTTEDTSHAVYGPLALQNVTEHEVALAIASFRYLKEREGDPDGADADEGGDGDPVRDDPPAAGAGVRAEGSGAVRKRDVAPVGA